MRKALGAAPLAFLVSSLCLYGMAITQDRAGLDDLGGYPSFIFLFKKPSPPETMLGVFIPQERVRRMRTGNVRNYLVSSGALASGTIFRSR